MAINVGGRPCELGFDWSVYQSPRELFRARDGGHRFMVIKATEGDSYRDRNYGAHVANAVDAGLVVGAYHFARPDYSDGGPRGDGRQEARHFLSVIDDRVDFVVLDLEATVVNPSETAEYVVGWWDQVMESGRFPLREQRITYVGKFFNWVHAVRVREQSCLWVPSYTGHPTVNPDPTRIALPGWSSDLWPEGWCIWQYTDRGTVAGVHPSDMNVATVAWLDAVRTGRAGKHGMDPQEDNMPRPNYQFPASIDHPNRRYPIIDLRNGAYPLADGTGVGYGPHWYHTDDQLEVFQLIANREVDPGQVHYFAAGNNGLDRSYEQLPHVYSGARYTAPKVPVVSTPDGEVDVDELVPALAGPVAAEIAQRASR